MSSAIAPSARDVILAEAGSRLFERITQLPEYYLSRVEHAILHDHADEIIARTISDRSFPMLNMIVMIARTLVVEALAAAFTDLDVWEEHTPDMAHLLQNYLTEAHRDAPGTGCAMGALLGDMTRGSKSARALYTERVKRSLAFFSALLPSSQRSDKRRRVLLILSALLGALNLSRAVSDPNLSREILHGVREELIGLVKQESHTG
jgi:Histidine-specific methyltransferase, SAM-dependent